MQAPPASASKNTVVISVSMDSVTVDMVFPRLAIAEGYFEVDSKDHSWRLEPK